MATTRLSIQELQGLLESYQSELKKLAFQASSTSKMVTDLEKQLRTALAKEKKDRLAAEKAKARTTAKKEKNVPKLHW
ncbi:MAG: hypothetical protein IPJ06_20625 [Saprospiraceae bacterium]|nr:hypothetical protein [Saprospiraceae bacterium]